MWLGFTPVPTSGLTTTRAAIWVQLLLKAALVHLSP
jgi:hypothetical protein